jgi:hypothetical protein
MRRLERWFREFFGSDRLGVRNDSLPFTDEEFARLIGSGRSEDMRILARGLAQKSIGRASKEKASIR